MQDDPRYDPVAAQLPETLPALTRVAAGIYARSLLRKFGKVEDGAVGHMTHPVTWNRTRGRTCWASTKPTQRSNHFKGWGRLIHDISHLVFRARHPSFRPHDGGHARLEREVAAYVAGTGWLTPKAPVVHVVTLETKLAILDASVKRWTTKAKRAATALAKLRRRRASLLRRAATPSARQACCDVGGRPTLRTSDGNPTQV